MPLWLVAACYYPPPPIADDPIPVDGKAHKIDERWFLQYGVATHVAATPDQVWAVLTDAPAYPSWNSTVESLGGTIAKDGKLELKAKIDPSRTFALTVSTFDAPSKMIWEDGSDNFRGVRTFLLAEKDGGTDFTMKEAFTGRMLPMIAGSLPDFGPDFEAFAADLKKEVEKRNPPAPPADAAPVDGAPPAPPAP
jgi:hypothetical protein